MRLDLAERLRCPRPHAPTALVVVASVVVARDLRRGVAGCPVCQLEARVEEGDVWFGDDQDVAPRGTERQPVSADDPSDDTRALERLIALLGLSEPGGAVLLTGSYVRHSSALARSSGVSVVVMHASAALRPAEDVTVVHGEHARVPFTDGSFRAAALGADLPTDFAADAVRTLPIGGRVLGAATLAPPLGIRELARDTVEWIAEREPLAPMVSLGRSPRA